MEIDKIREIVEGSIGSMIQTSNLIIDALYLKAKSKDDLLLVKTLRDKLTEEYIITVVKMYNLVDLEVEEEIRKQLEPWLKIRDGKSKEKKRNRWFDKYLKRRNNTG